MGLNGGRSIGMPKSSSERSSKSEFSDSEFVFVGVKFNGGIDMGDGGGERDVDLGGDGNLGGGEGDLGGDSNLGLERGLWGVVERGRWGEMGIWMVETVMWRVVERGIWGVEIFAYFAKQGECWERVDGELVLQGNLDVVERGIWRVGIFAYFTKQGEFWERVEGELVLQGNPHVVVCPCFSLDL